MLYGGLPAPHQKLPAQGRQGCRRSEREIERKEGGGRENVSQIPDTLAVQDDDLPSSRDTAAAAAAAAADSAAAEGGSPVAQVMHARGWPGNVVRHGRGGGTGSIIPPLEFIQPFFPCPA